MRETQLGYQATLKRRSVTTIYGQDIDEVTLDVEFQTDDRVRFKVMNELISCDSFFSDNYYIFARVHEKICPNFVTCSC